jgi:DNA-binding XRE family transcriptional regulator
VESFDRQLGKFLKKRRGDTSYETFGRLLGLRKSTVFKLENAQTTARLKTIQQICIRLKCRLRDIFPDQF